MKAIKDVGILELEETLNSFPKQTVDDLKREIEDLSRDQNTGGWNDKMQEIYKPMSKSQYLQGKKLHLNQVKKWKIYWIEIWI